MANNVFQVKRTTVSGRTPNTTGSYATNTQYIAAGEFALNMTDGILYSSNGSTVITVGANLVNQNITGNLTVKAIIANSSLGTAGQVLTTNSTGVYWSSVGGSGTVTSVATGNGMTGGPITTTGTVSILANNGITANSTGTFVTQGTGVVVNATGVHVNAAYINTIAANSATFVLANNGIISNSTGVFVNGNNGLITNSTGVHVRANNGIIANSTGTFVNGNTGVVVNSTGVFVNATYIGTISANNANNLGGVAAASYVQNTDSRTLSGNLTFTGSNLYFISSSLGGTSTNFVNNFIINTSTVGNQSILRTYHYRHTTGADWTGASTRIQQRIDVTDMAYLEYNPVGYTQGIALYGPTGYGLTVTIGGQSVFSNNVILGTSGLSSNGGFGTAGQVLTTNGTATYWAAAAGGGYYKGGSAAVGSLAVGGQNLFRVNANTLNTSTTFVAGENAQATGPISVASGITLTVESGARVSIV